MSQANSRRINNSQIDYQGLPTLEVLEGANRYNKWIAESIMSFAASPVLEIGSGTGNIALHFFSMKPFYATDVDQGLVSLLRKKFRHEKEIFVEYLDITQKLPKKFAGKFNTVFAVNVLEHIRDDLGGLRNMLDALSPNGRLILLLPAKKNAYTNLDKVLGHYRRYEKEELIDKLKKTGFRVEKIYFFNILGLLSWVVRDKFERKDFHLKPYQIAAFDIIVPVLKGIERIISIPVGISLIAVARKIK